MAFLSEAAPQRLVAIEVHHGVRRMVAPNPGPMTYTGTNTWLVEDKGGLTVIDPGPDDAAHVAAIAASGKVARIVLTHSHPDHVGGAPALQAATGAAIHGYAPAWAAGFAPDVALADGHRVGRLGVMHTPGHASDHLCFALEHGVLFTGDHVMSWNTSIVSPPDGDMGAYMASLRLLLGRDDTLYLCGHGPPLPDPRALVRGMLSHRVAREAALLATLEGGPMAADELVARCYAELDPLLVPAAQRTVLAHLLKLQAEGRVTNDADIWQAVLQ